MSCLCGNQYCEYNGPPHGDVAFARSSSTSPSGTTSTSTAPDERTLRDGVEVRTFPSGATRDTEEGKLDYEGFLSPLVVKRYAEYMHAHRTRSDGSLRAADDWQKGIPRDVYMKSMWRHFMDVWLMYRRKEKMGLQDCLCALMFNVMGYLFEELRPRKETNV